MTDDQLFGEVNLEERIMELENENKKLKLVIATYEDLTQKYFISLTECKRGVLNE